ncbi:MAG: SGNH/GDSL hydrolase family protein [Planctomycetaceae bacterium]|nr:SGNH/GDSL hydrolase family protein [Planctomycetaceae bacterium]
MKTDTAEDMAHTILITLVVISPILAVWLFLKWRRRPSKIRSLILRFTLSGISSLLMFAALEYYFYHYVNMSDGFGFTLSASNWRNRFGSVPKNSWGMRDVEHNAGSVATKKKLYVVGDSFTAGHGINNHSDRYANIVATELGSDWEMILIAKGGWATRRQLSELAEAMTAINDPLSASNDIVIWQYYLNDIEDAGIAAGIEKPSISLTAPRLLRPIVDHYYVANFVYWSLVRRFSTRELMGSYLKFLSDCFDDSMAWNLHQRELREIVALSEARGSQQQRRMIVVVYSNLMDISGTRFMSDRVAEYFQSHAITVINMADMLSGRAVDEITVNPFDGHANEAVNRLLAEKLLQELR